MVWIGRTSGGVPIEDFAVRAFDAWDLGRKGVDDGLALFVFSEDRTQRFEVGYGLEDRVPDVVASRIVREVIVPRIQQGDNDGAITAGMAVVVQAISGGAPAEGEARSGGPPQRRRSLGVFEIVVLVIVGVGFVFLLVTNPSLAIFLLVHVLSSGRGGGFGGGHRGGGFSGGGGRSGGGGASGSW